MPCVLPVLSLKMTGAGRPCRRAGGDAARLPRFLGRHRHRLCHSRGRTVAVKQAGGVIGWGIQFQHPWFLVAMTLVLVLFAANLLGWFELPLPAWIGRVAGAEHGSGLAGQFLHRHAGDAAGHALLRAFRRHRRDLRLLPRRRRDLHDLRSARHRPSAALSARRRIPRPRWPVAAPRRLDDLAAADRLACCWRVPRSGC